MPPAKYKHLVVRRAANLPDVEVVTLNRPESLNALNSGMLDELLAYFQSLVDGTLTVGSKLGGGASNRPRVVVLRGEGRAFCAGLDLVSKETTGAGQGAFGSDAAASLTMQRRISEIIVRMRKAPQPIVACAQGATCGGGLALILGADVRLAAPSFKANVAMATIGLTGCDIGISWFLPRVVGPGRAAEMMMTGKFVHAEQAERWGLVNSIHADVDAAGLEMAKQMLSLAPLALQLTKDGLNQSLTNNLESQIALEDRQQVITGMDPAFKEAVLGFLSRKGKL